MSNHLLRLKGVYLLILTVLFISCMGTYHGPAQFSKSLDVFSSGQIPKDTPQDNMLSSVYEASFEDVFRLAKVSASQAQFLIEKSDKNNGLIYASKSTRLGVHIASKTPSEQVGGRTGGTVNSERRYFLIRVKELTGESTEVTIANKVQYECTVQTGNPIVDPTPCYQMSEVHWPVGPQKDSTPMEMFHQFLNNNLISAGLL